jgi:hypothetical protein
MKTIPPGLERVAGIDVEGIELGSLEAHPIERMAVPTVAQELVAAVKRRGS